MNNKKISMLQFSVLLIYPILSLFSGIGLYNLVKSAGIDAYFSVIVAMVIGMLIVFLFIKIFDYEPQLSLPKKNTLIFGSVLGSIINIVICLMMLLNGIIIIYSISNFIVSQFLAETPIYIILILIGLVVISNVS